MNDPKNINFITWLNLFKFWDPLYSAKNLLPELPKKFVIKIVIINEKLIEILTEPKTSSPKFFATRKLNRNGTSPTITSAIAV